MSAPDFFKSIDLSDPEKAKIVDGLDFGTIRKLAAHNAEIDAAVNAAVKKIKENADDAATRATILEVAMTVLSVVKGVIL